MFERINKKVKGLFSSQRMKTLALMLLVGTTAAMAQNAAGDYSAGTTAHYHSDGGNCQVCAYRGEALLRHSRRRCHSRCNLGIYRHECVRSGCMINTSFARG